jgi:phosphoribosylformylglycinamidine (FGAM) synthase PurS component
MANSFIIEIHPKKAAYDPLARDVKRELLEAGEKPANAAVETCRLFKIEGEVTVQQIEQAAHTLLVDPVVETAVIDNPDDKNAKKKKAKGVVIDVWPKPGVTDPVGETVAKGLRDLGIRGDVKATSAVRYEFPNAKDSRIPKNVIKLNQANELIHDIRVR